jgi:hypothetical protein
MLLLKSLLPESGSWGLQFHRWKNFAWKSFSSESIQHVHHEHINLALLGYLKNARKCRTLSEL